MDRERRLRKGKEVPHPKEIGSFERHTKVRGTQGPKSLLPAVSVVCV